MERVDGAAEDFQAIVDYSHKPGAVESVLRSLRQVTAGRLVIVLGCGGDRDKGKRPIMGEAAARLADVAYSQRQSSFRGPLAILAAMMEGALRVSAARTRSCDH